MYMAINNLNVLSKVAFETCGYMTKVVFLLKISNKVQLISPWYLTRDQFIPRREFDKITGSSQLGVISPV